MTGTSNPALATHVFRHVFFAALIATAAQDAVAAAPAAGDTFVYRVINGYNKETRAQVSYRVESNDGGRIVVAVTADSAGGVQSTATEIYTADGNWLHHALSNHDQPVEYDFTPAYPAYVFPLERGKTWSTRVDAVNPATGAKVSVRVDAKVDGAERVRVAAGEFDTIRISRSVYAGDVEYLASETTIIETEWYAPSLGRSVRLNTTSNWLDRKLGKYQFTRGDWTVYELASAPPAR